MQQSRRVASSTGSRSGSSGSGDGVGVSSASGSTSGGSSDSRVWSDETCACTSFEEEEEKEQGDGPLADGLHAGKAKIEKVGDGDDDNDDGACESPNGDEDDLDDSANTGIDRRRHHIDGRANQGAETAMVTLSSQLIRSVEVDSTCCWNGAAGDQPLTDVRIVMVVCIVIFLFHSVALSRGSRQQDARMRRMEERNMDQRTRFLTQSDR